MTLIKHLLHLSGRETNRCFDITGRWMQINVTALVILHQIIAKTVWEVTAESVLLINGLPSKIWRTWQVNIVPGGDDAEEFAVVEWEAG